LPCCCRRWRVERRLTHRRVERPDSPRAAAFGKGGCARPRKQELVVEALMLLRLGRRWQRRRHGPRLQGHLGGRTSPLYALRSCLPAFPAASVGADRTSWLGRRHRLEAAA
jgi:hypothetical protein